MWRDRGRTDRGAPGGIAQADGFGEVVGRRACIAPDAGRDRGSRAVRRCVDPGRWVLHARRGRRRLGTRRNADARTSGRRKRSHRPRERRDDRPRRRTRAHSTRSHDARSDRGGDRRHRLRCLEPAPREHGRRIHPARSDGSPDDRRRARASLRHGEQGDRASDRPRHGCLHVRAAGRHEPRDRLVRAPLDPPRSRGDPVGRDGCALPDRVPVHASGLRRPDAARGRAHARDRRRPVRRREVRHQRPSLAHPRRHAHPRRDARGQGAMGRRGGLGAGRAGGGKGDGGVDGARRTAHGPPGVRRKPLPRSPEDASARQSTHGRGVPQDVRNRPPGGAVGQRSRSPVAADARAGEGSRSGFPRGRRLGAPSVVRLECPARGAVRCRGAGVRMGRAVVVSHHPCRAPCDARARRHLRPLGLRDLRRAGTGSARCASACGAGPGRGTCRAGRLHAGSRAWRRLQVGPDGDAARGRDVPDRHRGRTRHGGSEALHRPPAVGRHRLAHGRHRSLDDHRHLGAEGTGHPREHHVRRRVERRIPVRDLPNDRDRLPARPGFEDLVRRRARLGAVRADRAGRTSVERCLGGRPAAQADAVRDRRLRYDRSAGEVATAHSARSSGATTPSSKPAWPVLA